MRQRIVALLAPPAGETLSDAQIARAAEVRTLAVSCALLVDVALWLLLRRVPDVRHAVLERTLGINVALLTLDLVLTLTRLRRRHPGHQGLLCTIIAIEIGTCLLWVQATGIVSSYFLVAPLTLPFFYRIGMGYWPGLVATLTAMVLHAAMFAAEEAGWLRSVSLFTSGLSGAYTLPAYRYGAMLSILPFYAANFVVGSGIGAILRQREAALRAAKRDLVRAVQDVKQGRLSGGVLDGAYELGDVLGRGGMGEVYQARRLADGGEVAVKVLHAHLSADATLIERFRREAQAVARLPAEHVARLLAVGTTDDGIHYLVMDLLRGEDLGALLRRRTRLEPPEAVAIVAGIAAAVGAAHDAGIVHRDLKPQNVYLSPGPDGVVIRLLDFGVARVELAEDSNLTLTTAVVGSPGYLAPEQVSSGDITPATDVFALAAIAYRALTGQAAFPSRNPMAAMFEAVHHHPEPPSHLQPAIPSDVDAVLSLGLAKEPARRYADVRDLARDLEAALDGRLSEAVRKRASDLRPPTEGERTLTAFTRGEA